MSRDDEGEERVEAERGPVVEPRAAVRHRHADQAGSSTINMYLAINLSSLETEALPLEYVR